MAKVISFQIEVGGINQVITNFEQLEQSIKDIRDQLKKEDFGTAKYNELQKALGALKQTQKAVNDETRAQGQQFVKTADAGKNSYRALNAELVLLRKSYKDLSEADRNSPIGQNLIKQIQTLDTKLKGIDASLGLYQRNVGNYTGALQSYFGAASNIVGGTGGNILGSIGGGAVDSLSSALTGNLVGAFAAVSVAVAAVGSQVVKFNAEISDAQASVQKTTGFTTERVQELTEELKALDTRTSLQGLLGIGEVLGQLGVEVSTNTISAIDKLSVALGDDFGGGTELVTAEVGKLKNVLSEFKDAAPDEAFLNIGNALNVLSASGAATAPIITDFSTRIAGIASTLGVTGGEILGVSATLQELGTNAERGATGFTRVIGEIVKQPAAFAKSLGISKEAVQEVDASVNDFTELVNKDLFGAFTLILNRLKDLNLSNTDFAATLGKLGITGQGEVEVLAKLSQSQDLLASRVNTASKALGNQDSITAEFTVKNTNLAAELEKLGNIISESFINSGFSNFLRDVVAGVNDWFDADTQLSDQLVTQQVKINSLVYSIDQANISTEDRIGLIQQLQAEYPEFFANLDAEKVSNEELNTILGQVNETYSKRIAIIKNSEGLQKVQADVAEQIVDVEKDRARLIGEVNKAALEYNRTHTDQIKLTGILAKDVAALTKAEATRVSFFRDIAVSYDALTEAEDKLKVSQKESNELAQTTLQVNARIAQSGGIINEQNVKNLIATSQQIEKDKEAIKLLVEKGKGEEAVAKSLQIKEAAQKSLNGVSKEGVDIVIKSTSGAIQQLAVQGKKAADVVRQNLAEIDKLVKGTGTSPLAKPKTPGDKDAKKAESDAKKELSDLEKQQDAIDNVLEKYRQKRLQQEDKFGDRLTQVSIRNIKDQGERQLAEEAERYGAQIDQVMKENEALIQIQNEAEQKLAEAIDKTTAIRDTTKNAKVRQDAIQQLQDLNSQRVSLEEQIAADNIERKRVLDAVLQQLEVEHGEKVTEIIKRSAERDKAEFKKRQDENFKSVDQQFDDFTKGLERDFKDREIAINKARKAALDALLSGSADSTDLSTQVDSLNKQFDTQEAESKVQLLTDKLEALRTELALIQAINFQDLSFGLSPSVSDEDIQKVKDQIQGLEADLTATEASEADKRVKIKQDEIAKKLEQEKKYREQLRDTLLDVASNAANALLNIERARLEQEIKVEEDKINEKYDKRVELAAGNSDEIKKIEAERAKKLAELDKQQAEQQKDFAIKRALIEGALAIVKAFATLGPVAGAIAAIGVAAATAFQIAEIEGTSFAAGGYTGPGAGRPDETGEVPVGVVHAEEYVIPKRVLKTPEGASLARSAEIMRTRLGYPSRPGKFASGGFVPVPTAAGSSQVVIASTARLDDEQFDLLTKRIFDAVLTGSTQGTIAGSDEANRVKERLSSLKTRTEI